MCLWTGKLAAFKFALSKDRAAYVSVQYSGHTAQLDDPISLDSIGTKWWLDANYSWKDGRLKYKKRGSFFCEMFKAMFVYRIAFMAAQHFPHRNNFSEYVGESTYMLILILETNVTEVFIGVDFVIEC